MNRPDLHTIARVTKTLAQQLRSTNPDVAVSALLSAIPLVLARHGDTRRVFFQAMQWAQLAYYQNHPLTRPEDPATEAAIQDVMLAAGKVDAALAGVVYLSALKRMIDLVALEDQARLAWHVARDIVTMAVPAAAPTPYVPRAQEIVRFVGERADDYTEMLTLLTVALGCVAGQLPPAAARKTAQDILNQIFDAIEAMDAQNRATVEE